MRILAVTLFVGLAGCLPFSTVDIKIEFPRSHLENVLLTLEGEVRAAPPVGGLQPMDPKVRTEALSGLLEARRDRFQALAKLLEKRAFGEGLEARLVEHLQGIRGLSAKEQEEARLLAQVENSDREAWIREVAKAHRLEGPRNLEKIRSVYTVVLRRFARNGWRVQGPNHTWGLKGS